MARYVTITEAARYLGIPRAQFSECVDAGLIKPHMMGKSPLFTYRQLHTFVDTHMKLVFLNGKKKYVLKSYRPTTWSSQKTVLGRDLRNVIRTAVTHHPQWPDYRVFVLNGRNSSTLRHVELLAAAKELDIDVRQIALEQGV